MRDRGQDVAPDRAVDAAVVVEHHHVAGLDVIDVVADRALFHFADGSIADGERASGQAELRIQRRQAERLTRNAEPVHGVGYGRGGESREGRDGVVTHARSRSRS